MCPSTRHTKQALSILVLGMHSGHEHLGISYPEWAPGILELGTPDELWASLDQVPTPDTVPLGIRHCQQKPGRWADLAMNTSTKHPVLGICSRHPSTRHLLWPLGIQVLGIPSGEYGHCSTSHQLATALCLTEMLLAWPHSTDTVQAGSQNYAPLLAPYTSPCPTSTLPSTATDPDTQGPGGDTGHILVSRLQLHLPLSVPGLGATGLQWPSRHW